MIKFAICCLVVIAGVAAYEDSAANLAYNIYNGCVSSYSTSCIKPKALAWMSRNFNNQEIKITENLSIVKTGEPEYTESRNNKDEKIELLDKVDDFLTTHTLKIKMPEELTSGPAGEYVPRSLLQGLPESLDVPLAEKSVEQGRGFVKKVMIPFLLGLKFKTSVLVPLALALIALKTWKALTLGLISIVLSGAMVIFKFTKPKVVNYEVIHYPHHHDHHLDHHHIDHHHIEHVPAPAWDAPHAPYRTKRSAQQMAYARQ